LVEPLEVVTVVGAYFGHMVEERQAKQQMDADRERGRRRFGGTGKMGSIPLMDHLNSKQE
jgi:hypothetical protein